MFVRSRRRREARRRSNRRRLGIALLIVAAALAATVAAGAHSAWRSLHRCSLDGRSAQPLGRTSLLYSSNGTYLGAVHATIHRRVVPRKRISPWLEKATVAIEDRRFWANEGIDIRALLRAAIANAKAGRIVQGGSTITQQLVRSMYLDDSQTLSRKRLEACLALKLTKAWPKRRILTSYLNRVPYGNHAYGAEAGAETYFGRHASQLGPAQAALLAGLPRAPTLYDPFRRPKRALQRRNQVLAAMQSAGELSGKRYRKLSKRPLGLRHGYVYRIRRARTFFEYVRDQLVAAYGEERVRRGGLHVYTTLVPRDQAAARVAVRSELYHRGDPATAIASVDPRTGAIRALVGFVPGRRLSFNLAASARRQAGSAFKTFVLAEAIRRGANPFTTKYRSAPFSYRTRNGRLWTPHTYENTYGGVETLLGATLRSDNIVYAKLTLDVGPRRVAAMAHRLGIRSRLAPVPSIGLGSSSVSPLEMASAYATLAAGGVYRKPHAIRKVVFPGGRVDGEAKWAGRPRRVISRGVAYWVTRVLEQNVRRGTGTAAQLARPVAGKTGTTSRWTDAWFVGYARRLAAAVWVGYPRHTVPMTSVHGIHVAGGTFPARIWARYARRALAGKPEAPWLQPSQPVTWVAWKGAHRWRPPPKPKRRKQTRGKPGLHGYVVVLGSHRSARAAHAHAARLRRRGFGVHAVDSSALPSLRPGFVVVYAGPYKTAAAARGVASKLGGYPRRVG